MSAKTKATPAPAKVAAPVTLSRAAQMLWAQTMARHAQERQELLTLLCMDHNLDPSVPWELSGDGTMFTPVAPAPKA